MFRFALIVFCIVPGGCSGQIPDLDGQLASGEPQTVAWAAYTIGLQKRVDMAPKLVKLVDSFQDGATVDDGRIPPEAAAMEAVADALIRLEAKLPADVIMHLYPRFPAQTIILLSRSSDNLDSLMQIFQETKSRDLWLAAGNLLAAHPPSGFAHTLLSGAVTTFSFRVVSTEAGEGGAGSGCACDFFMIPDENFRDWPKVRMYQIIHGRNAPNVFAPGIHPVGFIWWETTDYRDPWEDGDCSEGTSRYWRTGLIAQLLGKKIRDLSLRPEVSETVLFTSAAAFEQQVQSAVERTSQAFNEVVGALITGGELTLEDSATLHFQCKIAVVDDRESPRTDLPETVGRWCAPPRAGLDPRLP